MPGFTYVVSHGGVTGVKASGAIDLEPLVMMEDPVNETFEDNGASDPKRAIAFVRKVGASENTADVNRPLLAVWRPFGTNDPRVEGQGTLKSAMLDTGAWLFSPGATNKIWLSPSYLFRGASAALVLSGQETPSNTPTKATASLDLYGVPDVRLPGVAGQGLEPPWGNKSGTMFGSGWGGQGSIFRLEGRQQYVDIAAGNLTGASAGGLIPSNSFLFWVTWYVITQRPTDTLSVASLGVAGDLTRFVNAGINTNTPGDNGKGYDSAFSGPRLYTADTPLVVTCDDNISAGASFRIGLYTFFLRAATTSGASFGAGWQA